MPQPTLPDLALRKAVGRQCSPEPPEASMSYPTYLVLDVCLLASELTLALSRRSRQVAGEGSRGADGKSLRMLWIVISLAVAGGHLLAQSGLGPQLMPRGAWRSVGVGVFVVGLVLRRWAIRHLGRFFTVDVAIASDHRVISDGPFRYIRHPSYTGLLLEFAGIGLALGSVSGWLVMMIPIFLALAYRVRIEEAALSEALGEPYLAYRQRTKKFVPGVY